MKKIIAVLLTAAMLIGICGVSLSASALQFPKVNDKINEKYTKCLSNSYDDGLVYVEVYFDAVPMDQDELRNAAIERSRVDPADLKYFRDNYRNLTDEEKQFYNDQSGKYNSAYFGIISERAEQNAAPFFEQMGITLQYSKNTPIYHNRRVSKYETSIGICLTKNEVFRAAELDYVEGIVCHRRLTDNNYKTLLFENTLGWENVYAYVYASNQGQDPEPNGKYPGAIVNETVTDEDGNEYYAVRIPKYNTNCVILSNGEGEYTTQITSDVIRWGDYYAYRLDGTKGDYGYNIEGYHRSGSTNDPDTPGKGNFVLLDNYHWKEAYIYALDADGNELYGAFPGKQAKRYLDYGGMQFQITVPEGAASIVVSNGKGEKTEEIKNLDPYYGYSLSTKDDAGDYKLNEFYGFLEEPGDDDYDEYLEPNGNQYEAAFVAWSWSQHGEECLDDSYSYTELYTHYDGDQPDWVLCQADYYPLIEEPMITWLRIGGIGGRTIINTSCDMPFATGYGVYDVKANEFYALEELTDDCFMHKDNSQSADKYEGLVNALAELNIGYMTGDANNDNKVDILDAALIQKAASGKENLYDDQEIILDVNKDNNVDILDATAIQKAIVA